MPRKRQNRTAAAAAQPSQTNSSPPTAEELLIEQIREAFAGVALGTGIGLWLAEAIDDYGNEEEQAAARKRDELHDWSRIPSEDLGFSNLCFVDAAGMCFLLPAYMIDFVRRTVAMQGRTDAAMYALTSMNAYRQSQFTTLTPRQRAAAASFLRWYLHDEEVSSGPGGGYHGEMITKALREYWEPE